MTAPRFMVKDRVQLKECPSLGTVAAVWFIPGSAAKYRVDWDDFPNDQRFYPENDLVEAP